MKKILFYLLNISVLFMIFSCISRKNTLKKISDKSFDYKIIKKTDNLIKNIYQSMEFEAVKISSKVNIDNGSFVPQLNATLYIENNKKIWTNITALFGIAGACGVATPNGIKGYEKFNKTYIDSDFEYINKLLGVGFIDYEVLQNLLIGHTFIPIDSNFILSKNDYGYKLSSSKAHEIFSENRYYSYDVNMYYDLDLHLTKVVLKDNYSENGLEVDYFDRFEVNGESFPRSIVFTIKNRKTDYIFIENTNFNFTKMSTPYSVPPNYTKIEIQ